MGSLFVPEGGTTSCLRSLVLFAPLRPSPTPAVVTSLYSSTRLHASIANMRVDEHRMHSARGSERKSCVYVHVYIYTCVYMHTRARTPRQPSLRCTTVAACRKSLLHDKTSLLPPPPSPRLVPTLITINLQVPIDFSARRLSRAEYTSQTEHRPYIQDRRAVYGLLRNVYLRSYKYKLADHKQARYTRYSETFYSPELETCLVSFSFCHKNRICASVKPVSALWWLFAKLRSICPKLISSNPAVSHWVGKRSVPRTLLGESSRYRYIYSLIISRSIDLSLSLSRICNDLRWTHSEGCVEPCHAILQRVDISWRLQFSRIYSRPRAGPVRARFFNRTLHWNHVATVIEISTRRSCEQMKLKTNRNMYTCIYGSRINRLLRGSKSIRLLPRIFCRKTKKSQFLLWRRYRLSQSR